MSRVSFTEQHLVESKMESKFDYIVVGAGIEGSWTAYHLLKLGYNVLLLEQFTLPHSRGSSHGQTRITRYGYVEDFHTALMDEAFKKWDQLEKEAGAALFTKTGALYIADRNSKKDLNKIATNLSRYPHVNYKIMNSKEIAQNFPQMKYGNEYNACWEENAGVLFADKCLSTVQRRFKDLGGVLIDGFEVINIQPGPPAVVQGAKMRNWMCNKPERKDESYLAKAVIICAGPWTGPLAKIIFGLSLPLSPKRIEVIYWKIKDKEIGGPPVVFIDLNNDGEYYGLPSLEYPGMVKICCHHQQIADPNTRDMLQQKRNNQEIIAYIKKHFPSLEPCPAIIETCMYTETPDNVCILDKHPLYNNIIFGCGFSGTGFKISPVIAHILGNMAEGKPTAHNIKPFALARFQSQSKL